MNILFFTDSDVYSMRGGIDRTVGVLSDSLTKQGYKCFLAFFDKTPNEQIFPFEKRIPIDLENISVQMTEFLAENRIQAIIVSTATKQHIRFLLPQIEKVVAGEKISTYFWFHGMPGYELAPLNLNAALYRILHKSGKIVNLKKFWLALLSKFSFSLSIMRRLLREKYAFVCRYSDKIIVLSKPYIKTFAKIANTSEDKFVVISNGLTFSNFANKEIIAQKEKIVLIVARIDEDSKRISLALKIWKQIEQQNGLSDWKLVIIGSGIDEDYCKRLSRKLQLKKCVFEGQQNPHDYYKRASIFLMTSSNEGFPMTLGEAQQMGVVPIAFDSFGAVYDSITNNVNGCIISEGDIDAFVQQLVYLMHNDERRQVIASHAIESCKQFTGKKILKQWIELFQAK